jgi:hypothetical protein
VIIEYNTGADGHYISEKDRRNTGLPILQTLTRRVGVANGGKSRATYVVTQLPFQNLSAQAKEADTFKDMTASLMSVGKTADEGTISMFTKEGVTVHKEEDMLITCKGEPILIGVRDRHGRSYTFDTTTRLMATLAAIQASTKSTTTSQQCL